MASVDTINNFIFIFSLRSKGIFSLLVAFEKVTIRKWQRPTCHVHLSGVAEVCLLTCTVAFQSAVFSYFQMAL